MSVAFYYGTVLVAFVVFLAISVRNVRRLSPLHVLADMVLAMAWPVVLTIGGIYGLCWVTAWAVNRVVKKDE